MAAVIGGSPAPPEFWRRDATRIAETAVGEGVLPLVVRAAAADTACPAPVRTALEAVWQRHVAAELVREHALRDLVRALAAADVAALLIKGADLAYSVYSSPDLRARTDTDILIAPADRAAAEAVLVERGYMPVAQSGGDLLMYQAPFRLSRGGVEIHVVDLHWRVFNPQAYGARVTVEELLSESEPRPALTPEARGLDRVYALLLACVHRVAHHFDQPRLIWLYDAHLLAQAFQPDDWTRFRRLALDRRLHAPCARTLTAARDAFGSPVPAEVLDALAGVAPDRDDAAFLDARTPHALRVASDFRHITTWRGRARLARQHLFPSATYMRDVYAPGSAAPLWALYVNRIVRGTRRWIVRS